MAIWGHQRCLGAAGEEEVVLAVGARRWGPEVPRRANTSSKSVSGATDLAAAAS